jgi:DDE superfamily endonuclease
VQWYNNLDDPQQHVPKWLLTVDGTHCPIEEPRSQPDKKWFSHKLNHAAVSYEIGLDIIENKIVWTNGPFEAGKSDLLIFQEPGGLKSMIPHNYKIIGDMGYAGEPQIISTKNALDSKEVKKFKQRARARHEAVNSFFKNFKILSDRYRHEFDTHKIVFEAVCVIVQYTLETNDSLFKI